MRRNKHGYGERDLLAFERIRTAWRWGNMFHAEARTNCFGFDLLLLRSLCDVEDLISPLVSSRGFIMILV